jgi:rRNA-processing protein FCF1
LDANTIFKDVTYDSYVKLKQGLAKIYNIIDKSLQQGVKDVFEINTLDGRIVFTYYHKGILMIQSSPTNTDCSKLIGKISEMMLSKPEKKYNVVPSEENDSRYEYFIGCDEAGAGESFGSMFLGCALISREKVENSRLIVLDTSAIISRIVTKDVNSSRYLEGNKFLLPSFVYEELDTKGPNLKKGGQKEILEMKEMKSNGLIDFDEVDTHLLAHGLTNDRKILSVLSNKNADLLTKDATMTAFGNINYFVLRVEGL